MNSPAKTPCPATGALSPAREARPIFERRELTPGEKAQRQQFLDSYVRMAGHEPSAAEIEDFERRQRFAAPIHATDREGVA